MAQLDDLVQALFLLISMLVALALTNTLRELARIVGYLSDRGVRVRHIFREIYAYHALLFPGIIFALIQYWISIFLSFSGDDALARGGGAAVLLLSLVLATGGAFLLCLLPEFLAPSASALSLATSRRTSAPRQWGRKPLLKRYFDSRATAVFGFVAAYSSLAVAFNYTYHSMTMDRGLDVSRLLLAAVPGALSLGVFVSMKLGVRKYVEWAMWGVAIFSTTIVPAFVVSILMGALS